MPTTTPEQETYARKVANMMYDSRGNLSFTEPKSSLEELRVRRTLAELQRLGEKYGKTKAAVMLITGLTAEEIDDVGGVGDE